MSAFPSALKSIANRTFPSFGANSSLSVAVTLCQSSGNAAYNPATAISTYAETRTALTAFRAVVTEKQATERIIAGTTRYDFDASTVTGTIIAGDRIVDPDGVVWSVYEIGDPDPTDSLIRVYTRRSPT